MDFLPVSSRAATSREGQRPWFLPGSSGQSSVSVVRIRGGSLLFDIPGFSSHHPGTGSSLHHWRVISTFVCPKRGYSGITSWLQYLWNEREWIRNWERNPEEKGEVSRFLFKVCQICRGEGMASTRFSPYIGVSPYPHASPDCSLVRGLKYSSRAP